MTNQQPSNSQAAALLPRWANNQDSWSRTIVADVLKNRVLPADLDIDRYLKVLLAEKKLSDDPFEAAPKIEEKQLDKNALDPVRLDSVKVGAGINAIKAGAQIDFAPGMTVIFGETGSGKSGFVRVLKRAAGIRLHVEEDLTYVFTPGELTLFPFVQSGVERVGLPVVVRLSLGGHTLRGAVLTSWLFTDTRFDQVSPPHPVPPSVGRGNGQDHLNQPAESATVRHVERRRSQGPHPLHAGRVAPAR